MRAPLQTALAAWRQARGVAEGANPRRTGLAYHRAVNHLQFYVSLLRVGPRPKGEVRDELRAACHALSVLGRESVPTVVAAGATHYVAIHARIALAAAHLADPAHGEASRVASALAGPALERFDPDGVGGVPPRERIAGAADVRMLLAGVVAGRPPGRGAAGEPWLVTDDASAGFRAAYRDRRLFRRAVLPSCAGLDPAAEALRLGTESVGLHTALAREIPAHAAERERARGELRLLARRLGRTVPPVG